MKQLVMMQMLAIIIILNLSSIRLISATNAAPTKYLSNYWSLLQMPLIKCKIELKLRWTKHRVLASAGVANTNADSKNVFFIIKVTKYSCCHFLRKR